VNSAGLAFAVEAASVHSGGGSLDVFDLHRRVIDDYAGYVRRYFAIRDERIRARVDAELAAGRLWPEPCIQVSPVYEPGPSIGALIASGDFHPGARDILERGKARRLPLSEAKMVHHFDHRFGTNEGQTNTMRPARD
jgi:hypothetical protein